MITCIHNSGYVKSDRDDLGKPKTPNTPEKFYFPRVSALILHSQGQIAITALPSLCPLMQTLEHSLPAHKSQQLSAGICNVTNWVLLGFCVCILINARAGINFFITTLPNMSICRQVSFTKPSKEHIPSICAVWLVKISSAGGNPA